MPQKVNYVVWFSFSLAIFLCLLFVNNFAQKNKVLSASVQEAYDELAVALSDAGILPGAGQGELISAFAAQTLNKTKLATPTPGSSLTMELNLGTVMSAKFGTNGANFILLKPENYKQLVPGSLRQALQKIKRLPYSKQQSELAGASTKSFVVLVNPNGTTYSISPGFNNQQCNSLLIN